MKMVTTQKGSAIIITVLIGAVLVGGFIGIVKSNQDKKLKQDVAVTIERVDAAVASVELLSEQLGATNKIPDLLALYEDSLASRITADSTSFTLSRGTSNGTALASSTYPFIIDEGTANEEFVLADCTGTACTNVTRGLSLFTGTTTVTSLKKTHGRGASVKITDGPILLIHNRLIQGIDSFPNLLGYESGVTCDSSTADTTICDTTYIRAIAGQGAATSTESLGGISELATALEAASSTDFGIDRPLVLHTKYATDTPQSGCAVGYEGVAGAGCTIIADLTGKIKSAWFGLLTTINSWTAHQTFDDGITTNATSTATANTIGFTEQAYITASTTFTGWALPQPAYIATSTGTAFLSDANVAVATNFHGFAVTSGDDGDQILLQSSGVVDGFTGLTAGSEYYVQDTVGTIGTSVGTSEVYVGDAISATQILIKQRTDQFIASANIANWSAQATSTVPLYTKTIVIKSNVSEETGNATTATLKWRGIGGDGNSVNIGTSCNIGTGACTSTGNVTVIWDVANSTLQYTPSGSPSGSATAYFYR